MMSNTIYTIGHSNLTDENFLSVINRFGINAIADVRSYPYSSFNPQFNRKELEKLLTENQINYRFCGKKLGGRGTKADRDVLGKVSYKKLASSQAFKAGLEFVRQGSRKFKIALMCAEKEPLACHRTILIAKELLDPNFQVEHIVKKDNSDNFCLDDYCIEHHHPDTEERLLEKWKLSRDEDLFNGCDDSDSREKRLKEAYERQENKIAYKSKDGEV